MAEKAKQKGKKGMPKEPTFEAALDRLEQIAEELESGELSLKDAISLAEEGLKLSQFCEKQLTEAEGKVHKLVERMGGVGVEPLAAEASEEDEED